MWFLLQNKIGLHVLVKTKVKSNNFATILNNLGQRWYGINNNLHHPGGRVWVIWLPENFHVTLVQSSEQQITVDVTDIQSGVNFWFTVVYGSNSDTERLQLWQELQGIKDQCNIAWCVGGDFNAILHFNERVGSTVLWSEIEDFRLCVEYCEMVDLKAQGSFYTWNNKQDTTTRVFSRIDRFPINHDWLQLYPNSYVHFMNEGLFDHNPCICYRSKEPMFTKSPFRYFNMWGQAKDFSNIIQLEWGKPITRVRMYQVVSKLKNLKKPLKVLNKHKFSDIDTTAELARFLLDILQTKLHLNPYDMILREAEQQAAENYSTLHKAQMSYLRQKAKVEWLKDGDKNTGFFHRHIKVRHIHNKVLSIKDIHGNLQIDLVHIEAAFLEFYTDLCGSNRHTTTVHFPTVRTVCEAIIDFFHTGSLLKQLNAILVTLIPKVTKPTIVLEFRPITCCNIIYKCIAKLLCARLGEVLPYIISLGQKRAQARRPTLPSSIYYMYGVLVLDSHCHQFSGRLQISPSVKLYQAKSLTFCR
ncbi:uncharacterized protein LOC141631299 [Silene latifolia]|uniref:uncharacterized protein LOC141631299 n=1 Tax=Silene latifolia TaxID=37657 RepID=UPI003D77EB18